MIKNSLLLVAALTFLFTASPRALARDAFNGTWKVTLSPAEDDAHKNAKEFKDTLTFKGSQFKSETFEKKGFPASSYDEDTRGGVAATFKCEVKNDKKDEGKLVWTGMSTGSEISGELTWTKADGTELKYIFKGEKQQ